MKVCAQIGMFNNRNMIFPVSPSRLSKTLDLAAEVGLTDIRFSMTWSLLRALGANWEPNADVFDTILQMIDDRDMGVIPIFGGVSCCWCSTQPGKNCGTYEGRAASLYYPPDDFTKYQNAVTAYANRWGQYYSMVEVMNEPNVATNSNQSIADVVSYHISCRAGIAASNFPDLKIIGATLSDVFNQDPEIDSDEADYFESMYGVAGFAASFDFIGHHPYGLDLGVTPWAQIPPSEYIDGSVNRMRAVRDSHGDNAKKFVYTEMGWDEGNYNGSISPISNELKGSYLAEGLEWQAAQPDTECCGFFAFQQFNKLGTEFSILDRFGEPTKAYYDVKAAIANING